MLDRGLEHRLARLRRDAGANRLHRCIALLADDELARLISDISKELAKIPAEALREGLRDDRRRIVGGRRARAPSDGGRSGGEPAAPRPGGKTPNLDQYTVDLTERAKRGRSIRCSAATSRSARWSTS